jgi:hypothetical protein
MEYRLADTILSDPWIRGRSGDTIGREGLVRT